MTLTSLYVIICVTLELSALQVKVILMSATFDSDIFANYFADLIRNEVHQAPVIKVEGNLHKVQPFYWDSKELRKLMPVNLLVKFYYIKSTFFILIYTHFGCMVLSSTSVSTCIALCYAYVAVPCGL